VAEKANENIEKLNTAKIMGHSVDRRMAAWVAELDDRVAGKLAAVGLIQTRASERSATFGQSLDEYVVNRSDVKPARRSSSAL
jgi:hypothetical protein